jgi:hypothetical protein
MSAKTWTKVNQQTFNAHLSLFEDVRSNISEDSTYTIYYTVGDTGQQWVGKVTEEGYYIALV